MNIVVVESPAKAKTINKYLGAGYEVLASFGHVRDLPAKDGSVDPDHDFRMIWEIDDKSRKRLNDIARAVKGASKLILATDPDREGEAISWHVLEVLKQKDALKKGMKIYTSTFPVDWMTVYLGGQYYLPNDLAFKADVPWTNKKVRQALNMAVNRKELNASVFAGKGTPTYVTGWSEKSEGFNSEWASRFDKMYGFNPARAKELLGVPSERWVRQSVALGYPADAQAHRFSAEPDTGGRGLSLGRKPMEAFASWERYGQRHP